MNNLQLDSNRYIENFVLLCIFLVPSIIHGIAGLLILEVSLYKLKFILAENLIFSLIGLLISLFLNSHSYRRYFLNFAYFIFAFKVFIEISYYNLYSFTISASTFFIILETNIAESSEYLQAYSSIFNLGLILVLFFPLFFLNKLNLKPLKLKLRDKIITGGIIFLILGLYKSKNLENYNLYAVGYNSYKQYQYQMGLYDVYGLHNPRGNFEEVIFNGSSERKIYVLVIGESTTRHRMGLYGYPRQTNPNLNEEREELLIFDDVISPHTHTIPSLSKIMSLNNYENEDRLNEGTIIQLMNQAGFKTYWISNQRPIGWNESFITKMAGAADEAYFINQQADFLRTPFDSALLPNLQNVLKKKENNVFIVLHLLGSHNNYSKRYPEEYAHFKGKAPLSIATNSDEYEIVNEYDNAILFNDHVISEVITQLKAEDAVSYMLYISDHGEDVYQVNDSASHTENMGTYPMFDVPFVLWTSTKFKNKKTLEVDTSRKYMLDDLIFSLADLSDIKFRGMEYERSIISDSFIPRKRIIYNNHNYDSIFKR